jgi:FkbM family methyltransferase
MRLINGIWVPNDEKDPVLLMGGVEYQRNKLLAAMNYVTQRRVALDIGAHVGLWAIQLRPLFQTVVAFEPMKEHINCFKMNARDVELHETALGDRKTTCGMKAVEGFSARSHINGDGEIPVSILDDYGLRGVDFIKIDCEGYEYFVVKGARRTIEKNRPAIIVEQKRGNPARYGLGDIAAVKYLQDMGMTLREKIVGDYILSF